MKYPLIAKASSFGAIMLISSSFCTLAYATSDVKTTAAVEMVNHGALLIDVRTPAEFDAGHLNGAHNIEFQQIVEKLQQQHVAKDKAIVLYCRSGHRAHEAQQALQHAGYTDVKNAGGYNDIKSAFNPITR